MQLILIDTVLSSHRFIGIESPLWPVLFFFFVLSNRHPFCLSTQRQQQIKMFWVFFFSETSPFIPFSSLPLPANSSLVDVDSYMDWLDSLLLGFHRQRRMTVTTVTVTRPSTTKRRIGEHLPATTGPICLQTKDPTFVSLSHTHTHTHTLQRPFFGTTVAYIGDYN